MALAIRMTAARSFAPWVLACLLGTLGACAGPQVRTPAIPATLKLLPEGPADLDDMCVWVHPAEPGRSLIVVSDKAGDRILAYDLQGNLLRSLPAEKPGNIDVRYGFPLGGETVDIVAYLQREGGPRIVVLVVDPVTLALRRVDDGAIRTGPGTGGALYRSAGTGRFYFFKTLEGMFGGSVEQIELFHDGRGGVSGRKVRDWRTGGCEGAVADDEMGTLYVAEEDVGIREVGAEPADPAPGELVIRVGENGLEADVEGLALYRPSRGEGYLIASNQSRNDFKVYRRGGLHEFVGTFTIEGALHSDGIEVISAALGTHFPMGLFASHTDREEGSGSPLMVARWEAIAGALGLTVGASGDPRAGSRAAPEP